VPDVVGEAARLRICREAFKLAMSRGISVTAARAELAQARWAAIDARLAAKRCGTLATPVSADEIGDGGRPLQWWQR
jgi:hypothetical protein